MGKTLNRVSYITAATVISNSDIGTLTDNGNGTIDAVNIRMSDVHTVLANASYNLSVLCVDPNINMWANYSPVNLATDAGLNLIRVNPVDNYRLGDFAGYNHQAITPISQRDDITVWSSTQTGTTTISATVSVGEIDWNNRDVSLNAGGIENLAFILLEVNDNKSASTYSAVQQITSTSPTVSVPNVSYNTGGAGGSNTYSCALYFAYEGASGSYAKAAKIPLNHSFIYTLKDSTPIMLFTFDKASASGFAFNSAYRYDLEPDGSQSINSGATANYSIRIRIEDEFGDVYSSTSNTLKALYTDNSGVERTTTIATNVDFKIDGTYTLVSGTLTGGVEDGDTVTFRLEDAVLTASATPI